MPKATCTVGGIPQDGLSLMIYAVARGFGGEKAMESEASKSPEAGADNGDEKCDEGNEEVSIAPLEGKSSPKD